MQRLNRQGLTELSDIYGDAFYLLDSEQFKKNYRDLTESFRAIYPKFNIAYSYKTNYTPRLCRIVNEMGGFAEVVSDMELEIALRVGVRPEQIIWNGPVKNMEKVEYLLLNSGTVNIDSASELEEIRSITERYPNHIFNIGIRCNFDVGDGVISRFGLDVDSEEFSAAVNFVKDTSNVHLVNLQCHFAKRNVQFWPARAEGMAKTAERVAACIGYMPDRVDIGGGLYGNMAESLKCQFKDPIPAYQDYAEAAATVFADHFGGDGPILLIEPGSALAGDSMKFVGRAMAHKTIRGKNFITMLGSQKNISMSGVNPPMEVIPCGKPVQHYESADIVGYTCIEGDVMYHNYTGQLAMGDFLVFSNCGSYSLVMKPPFIFPNFPVLDICGNKVEVIKRGEQFDDLFHTFSF